MFCPDCGREAPKRETFCPSCGYHLARLEQRLKREEEESIGWAERLIGRRPHKVEPPSEPPLTSYATGREPPPKPEAEEKERKCERCGAKVEVGALCPACGDKLPSLSAGDPYLALALRSSFRMIFAPKHFALSLPYQASGGTLQPCLYAGVFSILFLVSLPFSRADYWLGSEDAVSPLMPALASVPLYVLGMPLLTYLSAGLIHIIALALGGHVPFRRTIRVAAAGLIWLMLIGTIYHLYRLGFYLMLPHLSDLLGDRLVFERLHRLVSDRDRLLLVWVLIIAAWESAWMFGGLYRLSWWKTIIHFIATYWLLALVWVFVMIILPLHLGGIL